MSQNHRIAKIDALAFRCPLGTPVDTSFGRMSDRQAVFVRLEAEDGGFGWGEVFANWPVAAAEHRVNLIGQDLAQLVLGQRIEDPAKFFHSLSNATHIRALQSGEWGPFRQAIAGMDTALWDMKARAAGLSLRKLLNPQAADHIPAYASGIHIENAASALAMARDGGFRAFKVKVGFDLEGDARMVRSLAETLEKEEVLYTDANQAFDAAQAKTFLALLGDAPIGWLEEPIAADAPVAHWKDVAASTQVPLAGGENIAGERAFAETIQAGHLKFIQPDVAKWGGVSGCIAIARAAKTADLTYCPHFLGGGIGLSASTELLAAVGGDGLLEVDVNPNPLREAFATPGIDRNTGTWAATSNTGLGYDELPPELARYETHQISVRL